MNYFLYFKFIKGSKVKMLSILKKALYNWNNYKYRFFPWIMFKLPQCSNKENISLDKRYLLEKLLEFLVFQNKFAENVSTNNFSLSLQQSSIKDGGQGVFVANGKINKNQIACLYPGTVYMSSDSKFFQSLNNPFIFRCHDNICVDGKNGGISKSIYKSCGMRDFIGGHQFCDFNWLDSDSSFNIGQYVNNQNKMFQQNVEYHEIDVPHKEVPLKLRKFIPNINYCSFDKDYIRVVALIAICDIEKGEELFSNYFTIVNSI